MTGSSCHAEYMLRILGVQRLHDRRWQHMAVTSWIEVFERVAEVQHPIGNALPCAHAVGTYMGGNTTVWTICVQLHDLTATYAFDGKGDSRFGSPESPTTWGGFKRRAPHVRRAPFLARLRARARAARGSTTGGRGGAALCASVARGRGRLAARVP
jgi:hypothetical protein